MKLTETQKNFRKQMREIKSDRNNRINNSRNIKKTVTFRKSSNKLFLIFIAIVIITKIFAMGPEATKVKLKSLANIDILKSIGTGSIITSNDILKKEVADYIEELRPIWSSYEGVISNINQINLLERTNIEYYDAMSLNITELQKIKRRFKIIAVPEMMDTYNNLYSKVIDSAEFLIIQQMNRPTQNSEVEKYKARVNLAREALENTTNMLQPELLRVFDEIGMKYEVYDNYVRYFMKDTTPQF